MSLTKRSVSFLAVALLALGLAAGPVQAADAPVLERIVQSGTLRVGLSGDQPPYNAKDKDGELMGLEVDLAELLALSLRADVDFVTRPFPQLLDALAAGEVDVVMSGMAITPSRSLKATFVGPYMLSGKSILTNSKTLASIEEAGEINRSNLKLAALANSTSAEFIELALPEATLVEVSDYATAVEKVLADEVDALVADMPICVISVMRHPGKGLATLTEPLTVEPVGVAVSADDPQLQSLLDTYLDAYEATGILPALRAKWLEDDSWLVRLP
jgi:polar amino acid transport system substrate-binding protein